MSRRTVGKSQKISYRKSLIQTIRDRGHVICALCLRPITHPDDCTVDHIIPRSKGGDTVLDPFVGSGTTCLAAKKLNRKYIGIERESEYIEIANARLTDNQVSLV